MQKAWFYEEHGPKEVLKFGVFPIPIPRHNQLLVQVRAAALNPFDCKMRQRAIVPIEFPVVPGCDMAGVVVSKGSGVSKFEIGDKVYGNIQDSNVDEKLKQFGTLAEFIVVEENLVAMKPENVSFEEAASLPLAVQTAMEGFKTANFKEEQTVFIVGDTENSFVVAKDDAPIIDITWPPSNPKATYSGLTISGDNLEKLRQYLESGKLKAVIDPTGPYHFSDVIEAFRYLETGRARGKVVISPFPAQYFPSPSCITQNDATFQVVSQVAY
ncbi:hypothetical protein HYC85_010880 [Camellia sinensis]|uniref:Enoyl reductase (ER) domain-containing protein n=1 Tax=Camellia sinensis TaxID=4442 RepID=A0A7J7HLW9_CAMSI|nr:hypothetical protein HYC85_010880 [Camellia sinensis]